MSDKLRAAAKINAYCENCKSLQPSSFRPIYTSKHYEDLCCDTCHFILATLDRNALALDEPKTEYICKCGLRVVPHQCKTNKEF